MSATQVIGEGTGKIVFGTDGCWGIIADDFTFPNVRKVTRAIAYTNLVRQILLA